MKKIFLFALIVLAVAAGAYMLFGRQIAKAPVVEAQLLEYSSADAKLFFSYPDAYALKSRSDSFEGNPIILAVITDKAAVIPDYSEGPVAISIFSIPNPQNLPLADWIKAKSISNFSFSMDKKLTPTTVAGEQALAYAYSGLYENDVVAAAHNGSIYLFEVSWIDASGAMRADFQNILKTVTFK